jgi:hypothetical protein
MAQSYDVQIEEFCGDHKEKQREEGGVTLLDYLTLNPGGDCG